LPLPSSLVGARTDPITHAVDARWLMAYAAGIDDGSEPYFDTRAGVIGHPLFPVCLEWPVVLAARDQLTSDVLDHDELRRGVHATHDLIIHRPVRAGDELTTTAVVEVIERRRPGAYELLGLHTVDADSQPVSTTYMGSLFLGVDVDGDDRHRSSSPSRPDDRPPKGPRLATTPRSIPANAAHLYTETARIYNPIHTDPVVAEKAGLPGPILHGTATLAMAVSEVVEVAGNGRPDRVERIAGRFGAMVALPSIITTRVFASRLQPGGSRVVSFDVVNAAGEPAVRDGVVVLRP
jgi:acyl dehydratase